MFSHTLEKGAVSVAPEFKTLRRAYGFDEVALVPGEVTINQDQVDTRWSIRGLTFDIPVMAAAMDGVVDPKFAVALHRFGGLAVMNLEGVQTRYEDPTALLQRIAEEPKASVTALLQQIYSEPIKEHLIARRVKEIKDQGAVCAVSMTPANTKKFAPLSVEAGADIIVVQSTVTTARHRSKSYRGLSFPELVQQMRVPVVVGNTVSYATTLELMETGIEGVLVGVGPGAACTSREVLGVGVPQVTATIDTAAARDAYFKATGRYVPIITDGGMRTGGDLCKAFASGADAVMLGSSFAQTKEAPGLGNHWGMATPNAALPRGTRVKVGVNTTIQKLLFGPTSRTDGTENLIGALKLGMSVCGADTIEEMHSAQMIIAPSIKTEGKIYQMANL
ncbi:MAG: GuaB3 family IMP dehydrogenase-related protein [Dehalococcoidia bacterium]|nr:GuaB3 family IMP dehydrogenase-related protein [Dehalococcoidia bacterium]